MIKNQGRLLFRSCTQPGHEHSLDQVCVDGGCQKHELLCEECVRLLHKRHQILPLTQLLDRLDNMSYSNSKRAANRQAAQDLKTFRSDFASQTTKLRQVFDDNMVKLDELFLYFDAAEQQLLDQLRKQSHTLVYSATSDLLEVNAGIKSAVAAYNKMTHKSTTQCEAQITADFKEKTNKAKHQLEYLSETVTTWTQNILDTFSSTSKAVTPVPEERYLLKHIGPLSWSEQLKHSTAVLTNNNLTVTLPGHFSSFALIDHELKSNFKFEWKIKIFEKCNWIGMGVISAEQAMKIGFKIIQEHGTEVHNLCMICSVGGAGANGKPISKGKPFTFDKGDTIRIQFDRESREVGFEKKSTKERCTSVVDELLSKKDCYYPYIVGGWETRAEILE